MHGLNADGQQQQLARSPPAKSKTRSSTGLKSTYLGLGPLGELTLSTSPETISGLTRKPPGILQGSRFCVFPTLTEAIAATGGKTPLILIPPTKQPQQRLGETSLNNSWANPAH